MKAFNEFCSLEFYIFAFPYRLLRWWFSCHWELVLCGGDLGKQCFSIRVTYSVTFSCTVAQGIKNPYMCFCLFVCYWRMLGGVGLSISCSVFFPFGLGIHTLSQSSCISCVWNLLFGPGRDWEEIFSSSCKSSDSKLKRPKWLELDRWVVQRQGSGPARSCTIAPTPPSLRIKK